MPDIDQDIFKPHRKGLESVQHTYDVGLCKENH